VAVSTDLESTLDPAIAGNGATNPTEGIADEITEAEPSTDAPEIACAPHRYVILIHQAVSSGELGTIDYKLFQKVRDIIDEQIETPRDRTEIDVWLESGGGDASAAYKIGLLLRSRARMLRVVVPDYAKSAATLLSLAADEIYMAEAAELGPLDAQIGYEKAGMTISALDVARSLEDLVEKGISMVLSGGAAVLETTQLSRAESVSAMVDFATKFMAPMIDKLDPTMIHWSSSLLSESAHYARRLLRMRQGGERTMSDKLRKLPEDLVGLYPAHGFVISRDEARELGLPVVDLERYDYHDVVVKLARRLDNEGVNCVRSVVPPGADQPPAKVPQARSRNEQSS
jgi:Serine dehydrogenase proteinase